MRPELLSPRSGAARATKTMNAREWLRHNDCLLSSTMPRQSASADPHIVSDVSESINVIFNLYRFIHDRSGEQGSYETLIETIFPSASCWLCRPVQHCVLATSNWSD